jgi:hypothetical protein
MSNQNKISPQMRALSVVTKELPVLLIATALSSAVLAGPILIRSGESHTGNLESRGDSITIESGARVHGNVDSRNAPIIIGNDVEVGDVESRNGQVSLGDRVVAGKIETRNGRIRVGSGCEIASVSARNGQIVIGDSSRTAGIDSRNGSVSVGSGVIVNGSVDSRNGAIAIDTETRVNGDLVSRNATIALASGSTATGSAETRNGDVRLSSAFISQDIRTRYGSIVLDGGSSVGGDIVIEIVKHGGDSSWGNGSDDWSDAGGISVSTGSVVGGDIIVILDQAFDADPPTVVIEDGARVEGAIRVDSRTQLTVEGDLVGRIERIEAGES